MKISFGEACTYHFQKIAAKCPDTLFWFVKINDFDRVMLTFAVEALGSVPDDSRAMAESLIFDFLDHPDGLVREGAVLAADILYDGGDFAMRPDIVSRLENMAAHDVYRANREGAAELLATYAKAAGPGPS